MFLHIQDWSQMPSVFETLDDKSYPHGDKVLKVYASDKDPSLFVPERVGFTVIPVSHAPFTQGDIFDYEDRGRYTGLMIEQMIAELGLQNTGKDTIRALFRFANLTETQFCQIDMRTHLKNGSWLMKDLLEEIDGIEQAQRNPGREPFMHIDVFDEQSTQNLAKIVKFREDPSTVLPYREGYTVLKRMQEAPRRPSLEH